MSKVFLGVGHGGRDSGASANGYKEKDLNLEIALEVNRELVRHNVSVLMSRGSDEADTLEDEILECNNYGPDLAVDIHNNSGGGDGFEAYYHFGGGRGLTLAKNIEYEVVAVGQNSRGCKTRKNEQGKDYYGFIRRTMCPSIIVECAFLDNAEDIKVIASASGRKYMGQAIAKGILKTLNIAYKPEINTNPSDGTKIAYRVLADNIHLGSYSVTENALQSVRGAIQANSKDIQLTRVEIR